MIDVTPADFHKLYGGLVRMLRAIEQAGPAGLTTNQAGVKVFNSRGYGWKILNQADQMGYITREQVDNNNYYVVNRLTAKGRKLLRDLDANGN